MWDKPRWWFYVLLPLLHFASVKLTFFCATTPENEVLVWLPNAVLLAALLRFRGRRGWLMALLTTSSDIVANVPLFPVAEACLLSLINLGEVVTAYLLMRRATMSPDLPRIDDFMKFVAAGPIAAALLAGLLGSAILKAFDDDGTAYLTLVRVWWFGDGLGLLIYAPLLLSLTQRADAVQPLRWLDGAIIALSIALAVLVFLPPSGSVLVTPALLLPVILFTAVRFGVRWTHIAVAAISLAIAWMLSMHRDPFGGGDIYVEIIRAQEFILTQAIVGLGFAVLLRELKAQERALESKVAERTQALEEANGKLLTLSTTDSLTGLANRRQFDLVLASEWSRAKRTNQPLALALLDIDWFKAYNDHYGHQAGDECLRSLAKVFKANIHRIPDLVARYGGEEFALIAPETDYVGAMRVAEAICTAIEEFCLPHVLSPLGIVTASIGVAVIVPEEDEEAELLVRLADEALYQAKQQGRNRVCLAGGAILLDEEDTE